jgi:hypothetical protein
VAGKDIENQLGAVHHPGGQRLFEVPELCGGQVVVEENKRGPGRFRDCGNLYHLAFAHQRGRIGSGSALQHFGDNFGARTGDQLTKLRESRAAIGSRAAVFLTLREDVCYRIGRFAGLAGQLRGFPGEGCGAR